MRPAKVTWDEALRAYVMSDNSITDAPGYAAATAIVEADRAELVAEIVAWLREEAKLCNCYARSSSECACGAWDDWKTVALPPLIDEIEAKWGKP